MGKAPRMGLIHAMLNKIWGRQGNIEVVPYQSELFLIQFHTEASLTRALYGGPWHVGGVPLHLRVWDPKVQKMDFTTSMIPVWVQLCKVPLEQQTREGLSILGSAIGRPLHMDQDCNRLLRGDRIHLCVEVDFSRDLPSELSVEIDGDLHTIVVSYSWTPQQCEACHLWGYHQLACPTKRRVVKWVPKVTKKSSVPPAATSTLNSDPVATVGNKFLAEPTLPLPNISSSTLEPVPSLPSIPPTQSLVVLDEEWLKR
ncbi:hypothetical protein Tsubulata_013259 [Turnera subulata]|uniref:DUF4283 domain-containing protein n=1 Tax=Turnera subulata TaxID=218843 RepID=A0A9Q0FDT9_9ROSI|nr:hypothetical protein Tsubulata_013259 [Turnera subulata]